MSLFLLHAPGIMIALCWNYFAIEFIVFLQSVSKAMDAVTDFVQTLNGDQVISKYMIAGESKVTLTYPTCDN